MLLAREGPGPARLFCPEGCGETGPVSCDCNAPGGMHVAGQLEVDPAGLEEEEEEDEEEALLQTCSTCGWSVDGLRCCAESHAPALLPRNGFFERVACAYVWTCPHGCQRP